MKNLLTACIFTVSLVSSGPLQAQLSPVVDSIPMSDGRKLAADIYIPQGMGQGPVILVQTPYNRLFYRFTGLPLQVGMNINTSPYIFVIVDWRGFYGSAGALYPGSPGRGEDGYDCVEWIASQSWSNTKIGTWGPSALGRVQFLTAKKNPPHLTCICPLVAAPQYEYEEYFPNGCLRTEYVEQLDGLGFGTSTLLMQHIVHDLTWTFAEITNNYPDSIRVPCFMIGGWYDHNIETMLPFFQDIRTQSPVNVRDKHRLLMGPWVHGGHGQAQVGTSVQGELSYPNAESWNDSLALVFFDYYLRNISNGWDNTPYVQYYQMGENLWQNSTAWPPTGTAPVDFYLYPDGSLKLSPPAGNSGQLTFHYNPLDPSPTIGGTTLRADLDQGPYNQAPLVESRNDILVFTTDALAENAVMQGSAEIHLKISSDKFDTDFMVRLTDVYPDNRSMLVHDGVMRMRFRDGNTAADTAAMIPGQIYDCVIKLPSTALTFLAGHKIRIDISSSNYPRFNRNANTGGNMYPGNSLDSLVNPVTAMNTVYANASALSYIRLPLSGFSSTENFAAAHVKCYPNPVVDMLTIETGKAGLCSIIIYSLSGQKIYEGTADGMSYIPFKDYSSGEYMVKIYQDNAEGSAHFKIVKP